MGASHLLEQPFNQWLGMTVIKGMYWRVEEPVPVRLMVVGQDKNQCAVVSMPLRYVARIIMNTLS